MSLPSGFTVLEVCDPAQMDERSRISQHFPTRNDVHAYTLRDVALRRSRAGELLSRFEIRPVGDLQLSRVADHFGMRIMIGGPGMDAFCFTMVHTGRMALFSADGSRTTPGEVNGGFVYRGQAGTRLLSEDSTTRTNVWVAAGRLEAALEATLGERLRRPIVFEPEIDWTKGAGSSLRRLARHFSDELDQPGGLAENPLALTAFTDLFVHTALRGLAHSYSGRLATQRDGAAPRYLHRAEEYLRAHAEEPILIQDLAAAAGCSVRALQLAFRRFRDTSPHAAIHCMRLDLTRAALRHGADTVGTVARRYGFTNPGRFAADYARRFGELPSDTSRRHSL